MKTITYSKARGNLASEMDAVVKDRAPLLITRKKNGASVVMMSQDEYESMLETAYLLRSPANAKRLIESLARAKKGNVIKRKIDLNS